MRSSWVSLFVATDHVAPLQGLVLDVPSHKAVHWPEQQWKLDCGKRVSSHVGLLQLDNPGAGMHPEQIVPYKTVLKDGYLLAACAKDSMYEHGDKFGNNKDRYKMGDLANSSIVHYDAFIPKEDRAQMTPGICFEFCRGIPDMGFFGISNGRDCYCSPFFKAMASDSSECDSVCEGDNTQMCGGMTTNSIFSMHTCGTPQDDLKEASAVATNVVNHLSEVCGAMKTVSESTHHASVIMQKVFGQIGDPSASNQMQLANERSGEWLHESEKCLEHSKTLQSSYEAAIPLQSTDLSKYDVRKTAEDAIHKLNRESGEGEELLAQHVNDWLKVQPSLGSSERQANRFLPHILDQYFSIMYFVDKEYSDDEEFPVTCDGDLIGEPAIGMDAGHCAAVCDDLVGQCVGFTSYGLSDANGDTAICFLFSKFKTAQYYTGCAENTKAPASFLSKSMGTKTEQTAVVGWVTRHHHQVHLNVSAQDKATCEQKRGSLKCQQAKEALEMPAGEECYIAPDYSWSFGDLPGYYVCLQACCQDYDETRLMDDLPCADIMSFYDDPCPQPLDVARSVPNTKIATVCPSSCNDSLPPPKTQTTTTAATTTASMPPQEETTTAATTTASTTTTTTSMAPPIPTEAPVVVTTVNPIQPHLKSEIKAMCRAKFSLFGTSSLKPDPTGKSQLALKEVTKADRCFASKF